MTAPIENVDELTGRSVTDQDGRDLGKIKHMYGVGDEQEPTWVTLKVSKGIGGSRPVFVPLARLKEEDQGLRVPYSKDHLLESPEVEESEQISEEDDRVLREYYAVGLADGEQRVEGVSYAAQGADEEGEAVRISDA
jgi:hypothetical protein